MQSDWYKIPVEQRYPIVVQRSITSVPATHLEDQNENRKGVRLHVFLEKNVVVAGEHFSLQVDLYNPKRAIIHRISAILVQERILGPTVEKNVILVTKNLTNVFDFQDEHSRGNFTLLLPKSTVPSFSWKPTRWPFRNPLIVCYKLLLEAHIHGPFNNVRLQFPLIITNATPTYDDEMMPPPSYETLFPT
ncbi:unnamed protein product [Rotaria sp. Silwood2]|nr:unnamed protein product [Rotaria sp. Silwood2]